MTKVKICGLTEPESVRAAVEAGADYIGFVFAPSKRQVRLEQARDLAVLVPDTIQKVGVFVSPTLQELKDAIAIVGLDLVQIHGHMPDSFPSRLKVPVIRAIQVAADAQAETDVDEAGAYYLFDAPIAGSGQTFDWERLDLSDRHKLSFIAGGLNADNVREAIEHFQPYAVDVSSGVETEGRKDSEKIRRFIERVKDGI